LHLSKDDHPIFLREQGRIYNEASVRR